MMQHQGEEIKYILINKAVPRKLESLPKQVELPTLPTVYTRLQEVLQDENSNVNQAANIIENDQAMSLKLLKIVNSAAFGLRSQVSNIPRAISLLGFDEVSNIVLATSVIKMMPVDEKNRHLDVDRFWKHSVAVAVAARVIASYTDELTDMVKKSTFIAGLVHDIGKLIEYQYFPDEFISALNACKEEQINLHDAEMDIFGFSHQDLGAYLLDSWNMPRDMVKAVELHETPDDLVVGDSSYTFVSIIHLANVLVHFLDIGSSGDPYIPVISESSWLNLNIDLEQVPALLNTIETAYSEVYKIIFPNG